MPMSLREFQEVFFARRHRGRRRNGKKVGRIGLRGNYYDTGFFALRTGIGSLEKKPRPDTPE